MEKATVEKINTLTNNIFLDYANHSFREDPKNIYKVFETISCFEREHVWATRPKTVEALAKPSDNSWGLRFPLYAPMAMLPSELHFIINEIVRLSKLELRVSCSVL